MLEIKFYKKAADRRLKFAVIASKSCGKWFFCKHRERTTYEFPGGHRESGEAILDTAKRELQEETGALEYSLEPVCCYSVTGKNRVAETDEEPFGMLYCADIKAFALVLHSEMEKVILLDAAPDSWTYPEIRPKRMEKVVAAMGRPAGA